MSANADATGASPAMHFETFVRVRFHEVDGLGHVNNAAYLNYLEQAAIDHATLLGIGMETLHALGGVFLARRHDIVFHQPAYAGDLLRVETWLGEAQGARVERHYRIFREPDAPPMMPTHGREVRGEPADGERRLVVSATTEWIYVGETGRPRRIPAEIVERFRVATDRPLASN